MKKLIWTAALAVTALTGTFALATPARADVTEAQQVDGHRHCYHVYRRPCCRSPWRLYCTTNCRCHARAVAQRIRACGHEARIVRH